ncbi:Serine/threonine-protein phosphatase 7 long form like [Apostasia shenzhenica]|uniref:Serine/threonine-protein phosphatase 7 long form like n=1 Tax=Apostasia shenzhenica TaxID=1088818 RepID=A0A2I0B824_9ASPA|nr:Serine/threonine-protein phosphatase 7 long form like [Apostasia shenzhenica]
MLREWPVTCPAFIDALDVAGVGNSRHFDYITLDHRLLTALVEYWYPEINTFYLPIGEMTIMLQDVAVILGVWIDGDPLIGRVYVGEGYRWESWIDYCDDLLGQHPIPRFVYTNPTDHSESSTFHMRQNTIH